MDYRIYLYAITTFLSIYALSSVNFEKFIKTNRVLEAKILYMIISFVLGYLLTNFIVDFIELSKFI